LYGPLTSVRRRQCGRPHASSTNGHRSCRHSVAVATAVKLDVPVVVRATGTFHTRRVVRRRATGFRQLSGARQHRGMVQIGQPLVLWTIAMRA